MILPLISVPSAESSEYDNENWPFCFFEPPFGGLGGNVRWPSWAHGKARSKLFINVNVNVHWTFFARRYGSRRYERISVQNRRFRSNGGQI